MDKLLFVIWFFGPAGLANMSPVFVSKTPLVRRVTFPIDFGKSVSNKRILGDNKTFAGLLLGIIVATIIVFLQSLVYSHSSWVRSFCFINYSQLSILWLGPLLGLGALLGDAVESFFKRQLNIPAGKSWFPFDQIDYIVGGIIFSYLLIQLPPYYYALILIVYFVLHILSVWFGYLVGLRSKPI
jgi:CDP-2,3-bis-(O-geranylgeranyl)-sn-glycerol synthase